MKEFPLVTWDCICTYLAQTQNDLPQFPPFFFVTRRFAGSPWPSHTGEGFFVKTLLHDSLVATASCTGWGSPPTRGRTRVAAAALAPACADSQTLTASNSGVPHRTREDRVLRGAFAARFFFPQTRIVSNCCISAMHGPRTFVLIKRAIRWTRPPMSERKKERKE